SGLFSIEMALLRDAGLSRPHALATAAASPGESRNNPLMIVCRKILSGLLVVLILTASARGDIPVLTNKWSVRLRGRSDSSPGLGSEGTVYFGSWDRKFYALSSDGARKWVFQTGGPVISSPAIGRDGAIHFGSHDGKFYALRPDGTTAWEYATGGPILSS